MRAAAVELGWSGPDQLATSLRRGRVGTVAVVVEGPLRNAFHDPFALAVLDGLAEELDTAGRSMLLVAQPLDDPERAVAQHTASAEVAARVADVDHLRREEDRVRRWRERGG